MKSFNYFLNNSQILVYYVKELQWKLYYSLLTITITIISCYIYSNQLVYFLTSYLLANMNSHRFIFTGLTEVFFTYIKFSFIIGIIFSTPCIFFSFWLFFIPGLYRYEKKKFYLFLIFSNILFIISILLNSNFILPNILNFFLYFENSNLFFPIHFEAKLNEYLFFILSLLINIILCFQIPSLLLLLIFFNFLTKESLILKRKYFYISFVLLSSILAPPDLYSQFFLTLIIISIYEVFIILLLFFNKIFFSP